MMGYSKKLPMCPMKKLFMFFQFLLVQNCYANEYFCEFTKKVDSISFVESSEIENSLSEENQEVLKAIAVLADKVGRYHERLMFMERELEKHQKDEKSHCEGDCDCKKN